MATVNTIKRYLAVTLFGDISRYNDLDIFCNNELMGRDYSMKFIEKLDRKNMHNNFLYQREQTAGDTLQYGVHVVPMLYPDKTRKKEWNERRRNWSGREKRILFIFAENILQLQ
ncbi:BMA-MIG-32 [Dirofilaria immitis]|nr:BMA-MIG-32 [Dirofilaria immitis]